MEKQPKKSSPKKEDKIPESSLHQLVKLSATDAEKAIKKEARRVVKKKK